MKERLYGDQRRSYDKTAVIGMRERDGRTKAVVPQAVSAMSLEKAIRR